MGRSQIQLQLFGRPPHLAGCGRLLAQGGTIAMACRPVASPALTYPLDVLQPGCVGGNFLKFQRTASEILSVRHGVTSPSVEDQSTMEPVSCASTKMGHLIQGAVA